MNKAHTWMKYRVSEAGAGGTHTWMKCRVLETGTDCADVGEMPLSEAGTDAAHSRIKCRVSEARTIVAEAWKKMPRNILPAGEIFGRYCSRELATNKTLISTMGAIRARRTD